MAGNNSNRGLASADEQTRKKVASQGGQAYHEKRGQHGSDNKKDTGSKNSGNQNNQ